MTRHRAVVSQHCISVYSQLRVQVGSLSRADVFMEFPDGHLRTRTLRTIPVSRRSLEMRFKNLTGQTLQTEIWRAHLDRAKRLLLETDLSIYEVGENSGFRTSATFNVMFRRAIGMTPTEFRRQVKLPIRQA